MFLYWVVEHLVTQAGRNLPSLLHDAKPKNETKIVKWTASILLLLMTSLSLFFLELYYDRGNHHEFVSLVKDLARPGEITQSQTFDFEFTHVEKPYESYTGQNVKLR